MRQSLFEVSTSMRNRVSAIVTVHARFPLPLIVLCCLSFLAPDARGGNLLVNPGFETGDFTGWDTFSCCAPGELLTVTGETPHSGAFVADFNAPGSLIDPRDMALEQTFPAISTEAVNEVSYWMRSTAGDGGGCQFRAHYTDGTFTALNCPAVGAEWQKVDVTGILTPGKLLNRILILNGSPPRDGNPNRDFFDDFLVDVDTAATFNVSKDFSDNNPAEVPVTLSCSDGTVLEDVVSAGNPVQLVFSDFDVGVSCSITEEPVPGYAVSYSADCEVAAVGNGGVYDCTITNTQNPVTILAAKAYTGEAGPAVTFAASCDAGTLAVINGSSAPGAPAEFELSDFPYDGTSCSVTEPVPPAGYSQAASTCEGLTIVPSDSTTTCEIANAETRATFWVTKAYSDGNDDQVEVTLSCNNGLPLQQSFLISDGNPVNFVVTNFTEGEVDCEVTETGSASGYTPSYDNGTVVSEESCAYTDVAAGDGFSCEIINNADPATFTVTKNWLIEGDGGDAVDESASVTIECDGRVIMAVDGTPLHSQTNTITRTLEGDGDSVTVTLSTAQGPATCQASEQISQSGVESESDCGSRSIPAGGSSSCTITNTVFFEGIPTLSQYGLALLALLMLGVGLVGLRRFV